MNDMEQQRGRVLADRKKDQQERLDAYLAKLYALKAGNSLREVLEREMLLEFLRLNQQFIDEYPLLESQQRTVALIITQPLFSAHPGTEFIHQNADNFFIALNKYRHAEKSQDEKGMLSSASEIYNQEMVLIKCIQGMVYSLHLMLDNFFEETVRFFGLSAMPVYENLMKEYEVREKFWKAYFNEFFVKSMPLAYDSLADNKAIKITKTSAYIILTVPFDKILEALNSQEAPPELSRIQTKFMQVGSTAESLAYYRKILEILLRSDGGILAGSIPREELSSISKVVCIDDGIQHYAEEMEAKPAGADREASAAFLREQVLALTLGASMAMHVIKDDFAMALDWMPSKEIEAVRERLNDLDQASGYRLFFDLLQSYFMYFLQAKADGAKVQFRLTQQKRLPQNLIEELGAKGLDVQLKAALWETDKSQPDMALFLPNSIKALQALIEPANLPVGLSETIVRLWGNALYKIEAHVIIDLAATAKTTTNLNKKLAEVLSLYGVLKARCDSES